MKESQMSSKIKSPKILVTQVGSAIGRKYDQKQTLIGLGLNKLHRTSLLTNTPSVQGMVRKVSHLIKIEEVS
ncbi:MAG: 50S ribosomal protein L30 [Janthinobacterium lividum]